MLIATLTALLLAVGTAVNGLSVTRIHADTNIGSAAGGTLVTIIGEGIVDNSFGTSGTSTDLGVEVNFRSPERDYPCNIEKDASDENTLICETTPMPRGSYQLRIKSNGDEVPGANMCHGNPDGWWCRFQVLEGRTPLLHTFWPSTTTPGSIVEMHGRLFTDKTDAGDSLSSNGREAILSRVYIGGQECKLRMDNDTLYGVQLALMQNSDDEYSNWGNIKCLHQGTYVGCQNASFIINENYGRSEFQPGALTVHADYRLCTVQTYAVIDSVSPTSGSTHGGTTIRVEGNYFKEPGSVSVEVGGSPCELQELEDTWLTCKTPGTVSGYDVYPGGRGIIAEFYPGLTDSSEIEGVDYEDYSGTKQRIPYEQSNFKHTTSESPTVVRVRGFFRPAKSGTYTLSTSVEADVYLSTDHTKANKAAMLEDGVQLTQGNLYYYEAVRLESSTSVAMTIEGYLRETDYMSSQTSMSVDEVQQVASTSPDHPEIQTIGLTNWETDATAVSEVIDLCIKCNPDVNCTSEEEYVFSLHGITSGELLVSSTAEMIQTAINKLPTLLGDTVSVIQSTDTTVIGECDLGHHQITVGSKRGSLPLSVVAKHATSISATLSVSTAAVPDMQSFTVGLNGIPTGHVAVGNTAQLASAVHAIFGTKCPAALEKGIGYGMFEDFESTTTAPTGELSREDSYCGSRALKNPTTLFTTTEDIKAISIATTMKVCFAYKGSVSGSVKLDYSYIVSEERKSSSIQLPVAESADNWIHTCVDIMPIIAAHLVGVAAYGHEITGLAVAVGPSDNGFFIDNVFVGTPYYTDTALEDIRTKRRLPLDENRVAAVTVQQDGSSYAVSITPLNCGHNLPLIEIAYATASGDGTFVSEAQTTSSITVVRTQEVAQPMGGTFALTLPVDGSTYGGTLASIPWNATDTYLENAIETLNGVTDVQVTRGGTCRGYTWDVTFRNPAGRQGSFTVDQTEITNADATFDASVKSQGGLYLNPIPADWLRTAHQKPQVEVTVENVPSKCTGNCDFEWSDNSTPTVVSATPVGSTLTITGERFDATSTENSVTVGGVSCVVTDSTETSLTCTLGESPAGTQPVVVTVNGKGNANSVDIDVPLSITGFSPNTGSEQGGADVTVTGTGFSSGISLQFGDSTCIIMTPVEYTSLTCITGAATGARVLTATMGTLSATSDAEFEFGVSTTEVTDLSQTEFNALGGDTTITGTGFGDSNENNKVFIGDTEVMIKSWSDTEIVVTLPSMAPGTYNLRVRIYPAGYASFAISNQITYAFEVDNISPTTSSLSGGRQVVLTGKGFDAEGIEVRIRDTPCIIDSSLTTATSITCTMGSCGTTHAVDNTGPWTHGIGYAWNPDKLQASVGDAIAWQWKPQLTASGASYQVYTTKSADSTEYDENGFHSGPLSTTGSYSYRFNKPGIYYYYGCANQACSMEMRGVVTVEDPTDVSAVVSVKVGDIEATYPTADGLSVACEVALTPTIDSISPSQGNSDNLITITGTGFSAVAGETTVTVGSAPCTVEGTTTATEVTCKIGVDAGLSVGLNQEVTVNVANKGSSRSDIRLLSARYFALTPSLSSVSPASGSLAGGTRLTITGGGLTGTSSVIIGSVACVIDESTRTYTSAQCVTAAAPAWSGDITHEVTENGAVMTAACTGTCSFQYSADATPTLSDVSPASGTGTTVLTLTGAGFGTVAADVSVTVGNTVGTVTAATDESISCTVADVPAGDHQVKVVVDGKGNADPGTSAPVFTSTAEIISVDPATGSINGGTEVTIQGNGFVEGSTSVVVEDTGAACTVLSVSPSELKIATPAHSAGQAQLIVTSNNVQYGPQTFDYSNDATPTVTLVEPSTAKAGETITLTGTQIGIAPLVTIGGVPCEVTSPSDTSTQCTLGARYGGAAAVSVKIAELGYATIAETATFEYTFDITSITPDTGAIGGGQVVTIAGDGFAAESVVEICGEKCEISEVQATSITCETPATDAGKQCDVQVKNSDTDSVSLAAAYQYDESISPTITSISPATGGTGGGTVLTVEGTGLSGISEVTIAGSVCDLDSDSITETSFQCTTNSHSGTTKTRVLARSGSHGLASVAGDNFEYIDRWSSVFTWGGETLPQDGEFVVVQEGQTVLLDTSTNILKMLLIQGGTVIFEDGRTDETHLQAENILIVGGGKLQIGTEEEPYQSNALITMHGHLRSQELPIYGAKTLGVREGVLDMHGKRIDNTWVLLAQTVESGATQLQLQTPVAWAVGSTVVVASTGFRHSQSENEEAEIAAVSTDGMTLTLAQPLAHRHLGIEETYETPKGPVTFQYRAEVGLLTRNIKFQGSSDKSWHDVIEACPDGFNTGMFATQTCFQGRFGEEMGSDEFGASIMIHSKQPATDPHQPLALARLEYVELNYVGQAFRLGRYPIHWHLMGNMSEAYVRGCAIHQSFNRAVTIHGTHNLLVEQNVAYNVMGGNYFVEDGIETNNIIQYNLAVFTRASSSLLNDDVTPAAFWITNPNNIVRHNHAAGGTHFGFWYRMHAHPDGPSFTELVCQQHVPLGVFQNNTAHSMGWFGLWIFKIYEPMEGDSCSSSLPIAAKFDSLKAWHCEKGAEWVIGGAIQFQNFMLSTNEDSAMDIKKITGRNVNYDPFRGARVSDSWLVGESDWAASLGMTSTPTAIKVPMSQGIYIYGVNFINWRGPTFAITVISGTCTKFCGGFNVFLEKLTFTNSPVRTTWSWVHEVVYNDVDGTFTGLGVPKKLVPWGSHIAGSTATGICEESTNPLYGATDAISTGLCDWTVDFHRFAMNNVAPSSLEYQDFICENQYGTTFSTYQKKRLTHKFGWMLLLRSRETYKCWFEYGEHISNLTYNAGIYDFNHGDYLIMKHPVNQKPDKITMHDNDDRTMEEMEKLTAASSHLAWYYSAEDKMVEYMVKNEDEESTTPSDWETYSVAPKYYRCFYKDCIQPLSTSGLPRARELPANYTTVSDLTTHSDCFVFEGDSAEDSPNATIPEDCWVVWAVPQARLNKVFIRGTVSLDPAVPVMALSATHIIVQGSLYVGWDDTDPHPGVVDFTLRGNTTSEELDATGSLALGAKVLACLGRCEIHGLDPGVVKTKLRETVLKGSTTLPLLEPVPWVAGNVIALAPTGFNPWNSEKAVVSSVSDDGMTLVLAAPLEHDHKAATFSHASKTDSSRTWEVEMLAEIVLLSRKITIQGEIDDDILDDGFGVRTLVGTAGEFEAISSFTSVQFKNAGQLGHSDSFDPRIQLAYKSAGPGGKVEKCSFQDGFSIGVGLYSTSATKVYENVFFHTVGGALVDEGISNDIKDNVAILDEFPFTYRDRFVKSWEYHGAFTLDKSQNAQFNNNTVAGAERAAFQVAGQPCQNNPVSPWSGNVAHATLIGVYQIAASSSCTLLNDFTIYKAWDYGIYHQVSSSAEIVNCKVLDAQVGYAPIVFGPPSLTHQFEDKYAKVADSVFVGRTSCDADDLDENTDDSLTARRVAGANKKAPSNSHGGRIAVLLPMFASGQNGATFKSLLMNKNYPSIRGKLTVEGVTFASYQSEECSGITDVVLHTAGANEDFIHPTDLSETQLVAVSEAAKVDFLDASLSKVNPADCVDMPCDAKKQVLVKDTDGSFLGEVGAVIPKSEFQWGEDPRYGTGDYRVPKVMRSDENGQKIPVDDIAKERGIPRNDACTWVPEWNAYKCVGVGAYDYKVLVMESLDPDTELRRLSPVGILCNDHMNLANGPQDHGWCAGYTCQKRISTFWIIVPNQSNVTIYFSGTNPKKTRFHLLDPKPEDKVVLSVWNPIPQKQEVSNANGVVVTPSNAYSLSDGKVRLAKPTDENIPTLSAPSGANVYDFDTKLTHIALGGDGGDGDAVVTVETKDSVIVNFGFPAVALDEFFEDNLINNLAALLGIEPANIRYVNVVRETSSRRKRSEDGTVIKTVEISTDDATAARELIIDEVQVDKLEEKLGVGEIESVSIGKTMDAKTIAETDEALRSSDSSVESFDTVRAPTKISLVTSPAGEELSVFNATIHILDDTDTLVSTTNAWKVNVTLDSKSDSLAELSGKTVEVTFENGEAKFTDLSISHSGTYTLVFTAWSTASDNITLSTTSPEIVITERTVNVNFEKLTPELPKEGDNLQFELQLVDEKSEALTQVSHKELTWKVEICFDDPNMYTGVALSDTNVVTFDGETGKATTSISLSGTSDYLIYNLKFRLYTEPATTTYDKTIGIKDVQIYPTNEADYKHNGGVTMQLVFLFVDDYDTVLQSSDVKTVQTGTYNDMASKFDKVYLSPFIASKSTGSRKRRSTGTTDGKLTITTTARGTTQEDLDQFIEDFEADGRVNYGSTQLTLASSCGITKDGSCYGEEATTVQDTTTTSKASAEVNTDSQTTIIIFAALGGCVVLAAIIITTTCLVKRQNTMTKVSAMRCLDARSGSPESQAPLYYSLDSFRPGTGKDWRGATPDSFRAYDNMTPVAQA
uniref:fibrocystin-L-like n=1 Tax=Styela clava TaxID=7725 RepID=UPI00193A036E|nr:fibrocystin-L-like [Styela clava]